MAQSAIQELTPYMAAYSKEFADSGNINWLPYTMYFHPFKFKSNIVATDNFGFRYSEARGLRYSVGTPASSEPVRLLVGSSTVFGIGASADRHTLASRLTENDPRPEFWINFGGRSFNSTQDEPLVAALARSRLVRPGEPDRSQILGGLVQPDGRMFRVFTDNDLAVIRRWIVSLRAPEAATTVRIEAPGISSKPRSSASQIDAKVGRGSDLIGEVPGSVRQAYTLLQGRSLAPRTRAFALDYCRFRLEAGRRSIGLTDRSLPAEWQPGNLRRWLLDRHDHAGTEFEKSVAGEQPDRETVIDQTLQLAPLTLIDGAWLQGFTDVTLAATRVGAPLFQTYWDELGNGDITINHPKIYRDLLRSMGFDLAPTGSPAFANDRRLRDSSFFLPVFWLCLGKLPVTMRPEILGLNLAMELSGVGGSYRAARRFLKLHGFSTQFVDLHNTIDNVATGHAAWAADAIDAHLTEVGDVVDLDQEWGRVRAGFEALAPIVRRESELDYFAHVRPVQAAGPVLSHMPMPMAAVQASRSPSPSTSADSSAGVLHA